ncbi:cytochrome P450 [Nocardia albiluteola]|uniref:cytochrome P450 n=1 Tax=Nocardia albiluteola TaxID=2842303 RepID=UPI0027DFF783|nr:cytochrome P450 [Nocardia albiluteola]
MPSLQQPQEPRADAAPPRPIEDLGPRVPIYTEQFAADPHGTYREMRDRYGTLVPVEIWPGVPATLVIGYSTAVRILNDPEHFSADPRPWEKTMPANLPIMPMIEWRPNALRSNGSEHARYRAATNDALGGVNLHSLHSIVERAAIPLVNSFCTKGTADLLTQYIQPLTFTVFNEMIGCPPHIGQRVAEASAALFEGVDTATVNAMFGSALIELTQSKRAQPADDITTRLVQHPAELTDEEMVHQLVTIYSASSEGPQNLIANSLLLILSDSRFRSDDLGFVPATSAALDETLTTDPPMANYCITYPRHPILVDNVWLPANQPVFTSMAACSSSPEINTGDFNRNGWNLAWGAGPHACPAHARSAAYAIAQNAIDQLLDLLPEIALAMPANELIWRPGPFHRALAALPVVFPPTPPLQIGERIAPMR